MSTSSLRLVFAGTPEFAASHLKALIESEHQLLAAYTQPDRPAGRGKTLRASPVKELAESAGIAVLQPDTLRSAQAQVNLADLAPDLMVVVAYGLLLPEEILALPKLGCLNVHASLLPRWRGAAPIQRAIEAGDDRTGVSIMQMDAGLDTGPVLATAECAIAPRANAAELLQELAKLGPKALLSVLADIEAARAQATAQDDTQANYAHKLEKAEAAIDWQRDALTLDRQVRAFNPFPICYSYMGEERVRIWQARPIISEQSLADSGEIVRTDSDGIHVACGRGVLVIEALQLAGGKVLSSEQLLTARQAQFAVGKRFELTSASAH